MRNTIYTIIEPLTLKLTDHKLQVDLLKKQFQKSEKALEHVEEVVLNKQKKNMPTIFDQLYNKIADVASEAHERDEDLKKRIDILSIRANKSEESILTLLSQNQRIENHIRIALKDVSTVQADVASFKEQLETKLKEETDNIAQKWAQIKLSVKQSTDLVNDLQKQQNFSQDDINRHHGMLNSHQEYLEGINRRITKTEQIKLDETLFNEAQKHIDLRIKDIKNQVIDVVNNLKSTDNYLEKYLPFNNFCQLFEVLRLTIEQNQINKVKDYEEYRLKELYDIILTDSGDTKTSFNKKYVIQPVGYELENLATQEAKLQSKSKRFIMGRPSLSSSVKLNEKGEPIIEQTKNSFYGIGARFQQMSKNEKKKKQQDLDKKKRLDFPNLTLERNSKSMKEGRPDPKLINKQVEKSFLGPLVEDPRGEDMSQFSVNDKDDEDDEIDERMNDAIEDLLANMHEDNSSLGIKNLDYLKKKLFDPEIELITLRIDSKVKEMQQEFQKERARFKFDYEIIDKSKNSAIEAFSLEIDGFNKILKEYQEDMHQNLKNFKNQLDQLQNMYNFLNKKHNQQLQAGHSQYNNNQSPSSHYQQPHHSYTHMTIRNNISEGKKQKSRNQGNSSAMITDYAQRSTYLTNANSTKVSNYNNLHQTAIDQLKSYNNQTLFIRGGSKPILNDSLNKTLNQDDIHMHSSYNKNSSNKIDEDHRPKTEIIRHRSAQKRMIVIPSNQNQNLIIKSSINNAATSTYKQDASQQNSMIL